MTRWTHLGAADVVYVTRVSASRNASPVRACLATLFAKPLDGDAGSYRHWARMIHVRIDNQCRALITLLKDRPGTNPFGIGSAGFRQPRL